MIHRLAGVSRAWKRRIILAADALLIFVSFVLATVLRLGISGPEDMLGRAAPAAITLEVLGLALVMLFGIHSIKLSSFDLRALGSLGIFAFTFVAVGTFLNAALSLGAPRTLPAIQGVVLFALMVGWKGAGRWLLTYLRLRERKRIPVAIYGAGAVGTQLIAALGQSEKFRVMAIVDDSPSLRDVYISGLRVQNPAILENLVRSRRIARVVLAMPSVPRRRQREIVAELEALPCEVHSVPGYAGLIEGGDLLSSVTSISSDDLLGRNIVDLDIPDVAKTYAGRCVMISGAGGSIGSELCRQVMSCNPRRIVLFERSEFALYSIDCELRPLAEEAGVEIAAVLGSVCDRNRVRSVLSKHRVDIVLHAAAYKHVPLVEGNEIEGIKNNVFGTRTIAEVACELEVERFIMISTDKAVRPTNVMGATKRLAEMVIQDLQTRSATTRFAMVRFGNVLGSSGSVIPLFSSQIAAGGPITLTHPDVTRFFMTMTEAARLVLLAGAYADGGDLFVLDMGKPIRIGDLARRMVELSGLTVKDADQPDGDIEIEVVGLRPGEKLFEELLIDGIVLPTPHPKILRAEEARPSQAVVAEFLQELRSIVEAESAEAVRRRIFRWVGASSTGPVAGPRPADRASPLVPIAGRRPANEDIEAPEVLSIERARDSSRKTGEVLHGGPDRALEGLRNG